MNWVFWAIVGAAVIHIAEEYRGDFIGWFARATKLHITMTEFVIVNALFVLLCLAAALAPERNIAFRLSVAGLLFVNACLHVMGAVSTRSYAPGLVSAVVLYLPLAFYAYYLSVDLALATLQSGLRGMAFGVLWQAVPLLFHFAYRNIARIGPA